MTKNQISLIMCAVGLAALALTVLVPAQTAVLVTLAAYLFGVATKRLGSEGGDRVSGP